eukprot:215996-Karenia_brevis.AAC.1
MQSSIAMKLITECMSAANHCGEVSVGLPVVLIIGPFGVQLGRIMASSACSNICVQLALMHSSLSLMLDVST